MPKSAQYTITWSPAQACYLITGPEMAVPACFSVEWLGEHRAFAFHGRNGQINLLKEKRRRGGEGYWYAYRRQQGQMLKRYVGRDEQVNMEQLEELARLLAEKPVESISTPEKQAESVFFPESSVSLVDLSVDEKVAPGALVAAIPRTNPFFFEPLLMPKLQLPRLQKALLPREHLLELLDQGLGRKITLVAAPAGYGKTTLIAQWIADRADHADFPRVALATFDEDDNDPISFWRYVIAACQKFAPTSGKEALELLLAHRLPPFQFKSLEVALVTLLNALSQLEHPGVLVLDNLHVISSPQVFESLSFFLEHLPTRLHLILLMRGDLPFPLMRLRARNELLDITAAYLAFSLEETRAFLAQELPFALSSRVIRQIYQRLEGWPAGLRLFSKGWERYESEQEIEQMFATFVGNHWSIREYFLGEVLHTLPVEQQEFLLQTSVLPRITPALCDVVMDREDSAQLIEVLRSGDFFLIPLDRVGEWSRYQSLFAEAMQQEARRRLGDERLDQLAVKASTWYEEHGLLSEAIETVLNVAANTANRAHAASLIARFIESKRSNGSLFLELHSLKCWLESLPEDELERNPDFCLYYAMILLFTMVEGSHVQDRHEQIYHLLQVAEQRWRDANDTAKLAKVFSFRALLARREGRMLQALTWAKQALAWLPGEDLTWRTIALTVVGIGEILSGTLVQAREFLQEAQMLNERMGNIIYGRATRGMLSWVHMEQGEIRYAAEQFRQMQVEARLQEDHDDIARTQLGLALIFYQWNDLEKAEQSAYEAQALGEQMGEEEFLWGAALRLALIEQARGHRAQAQQRLTAWLAHGQIPVSPQSYQQYREVQATLARMQLANGDLAAVRRWSSGLEQRAEILPLSQRQYEHLLISRLMLAEGEFLAAIEILEGLGVNAQQTGHMAFKFDIQVALALAYARQGNHARARTQLYEVLAAVQSEGYLRLFLDEGEEMAGLLREILPHLHGKALLVYTQDILDAFAEENSGSTVEKTVHQTLLLEPLSPQEQKVLRLLVMGNSNAEIARELIVSINTIRTQVQSIYRKLDVNNRIQASASARQLNLV